MNILIALIPAIGWGIVPIITGKIGGTAANQIFGIGSGATIIGLIVYFLTKPSISLSALLFSILVGALWTIGQIGQFISFTRIGVSGTVPLSTVFQLVGNSIIGMIIFGDWSGTSSKVIGIIALIIVIIGALMTSISDKTNGQRINPKDVAFLLITTIGFWIYSSFPNISIVKNENSTAIFLPEMIGILLGAIIYDCFTNVKVFKQKEQYLNILAGLAWGIAGFTYILSAKANGNTSAFIWTQLNVVIATFGGIFILHESKTKRELKYTILGIVLIVIGSIATSFA